MIYDYSHIFCNILKTIKYYFEGVGALFPAFCTV